MDLKKMYIIKNKNQMFLAIGVFTLVLMLGTVTYAFFNYTRTGSANTISTGRISFTTSQETLTLTNAFPISSEDALTDTDNTAEAIITITGDTEYSEGIEYLITAEDVHMTIGEGNTTKTVPVSIIVTPEKTGDLGSELTSNNYWEQRGKNTSFFSKLSSGLIEENGRIFVGYIVPGSTGVNGTIGIKVYLDADKIAISDTYPPTLKYELKENMTSEDVATCRSILSSYNATEAFCNGTGTINYRGTDYTFLEALNIYLIFTNSQKTQLVNAGIINVSYTDETTHSWRDGRTILTTEEWNSLSSTPISFKIKVEANEGVWVTGTLTSYNAVFTKTGEYAANVSVVEGNIKVETSVSIGINPESGDYMVSWGDLSLFRYNTSTNTYDNITDSGEYEKIILMIEGHSGPGKYELEEFAYNGTNFVSGNNLDIEFVEYLINNGS